MSKKTELVVVYGEVEGCGISYPSLITLARNKKFIASQLHDEPNLVLLEQFEAVSWTAAMTYYNRKYFDTTYETPEDWGPETFFEDEEYEFIDEG
jgi:hypothetical protein